ncbi:hypothetical protein AAF712_013938 [Marasmius tenuissimus]|uniref:BTB domain-containing protein n=1 Tax=Marasmius tenuissimus TaxID=585030 RepID=A0ABR2ZDM1_9AGAR
MTSSSNTKQPFSTSTPTRSTTFDTNPPSLIADEPFCTLKGDATIITMDNIIFIIHRTVLTLVSVYFLDLFRNKPEMHWATDTKQMASQFSANALAVFRVKEDSDTFKHVLAYIHPGLHPLTNDLDFTKVSRIFEAMIEYKMTRTPVFNAVLDQFSTLASFSSSNEVKLLAFALLNQSSFYIEPAALTIATREVVQSLLSIPFNTLASMSSSRIEQILSLATFHKLLELHRKHSEAIFVHVPTFLAWPTGSSRFEYCCSAVHPVTQLSIPVEDLEQAFNLLRFHEDIASCPYKLRHLDAIPEGVFSSSPWRAIACSHCENPGCRDMAAFIQGVLSDEVDIAVKEISVMPISH